MTQLNENVYTNFLLEIMNRMPSSSDVSTHDIAKLVQNIFDLSPQEIDDCEDNAQLKILIVQKVNISNAAELLLKIHKDDKFANIFARSDIYDPCYYLKQNLDSADLNFITYLNIEDLKIDTYDQLIDILLRTIILLLRQHQKLKSYEFLTFTVDNYRDLISSLKMLKIISDQDKVPGTLQRLFQFCQHRQLFDQIKQQNTLFFKNQDFETFLRMLDIPLINAKLIVQKEIQSFLETQRSSKFNFTAAQTAVIDGNADDFQNFTVFACTNSAIHNLKYRIKYIKLQPAEVQQIVWFMVFRLNLQFNYEQGGQTDSKEQQLNITSFPYKRIQSCQQLECHLMEIMDSMKLVMSKIQDKQYLTSVTITSPDFNLFDQMLALQYTQTDQQFIKQCVQLYQDEKAMNSNEEIQLFIMIVRFLFQFSCKSFYIDIEEKLYDNYLSILKNLFGLQIYSSKNIQQIEKQVQNQIDTEFLEQFIIDNILVQSSSSELTRVFGFQTSKQFQYSLEYYQSNFSYLTQLEQIFNTINQNIKYHFNGLFNLLSVCLLSLIQISKIRSKRYKVAARPEIFDKCISILKSRFNLDGYALNNPQELEDALMDVTSIQTFRDFMQQFLFEDKIALEFYNQDIEGVPVIIHEYLYTKESKLLQNIHQDYRNQGFNYLLALFFAANTGLYDRWLELSNYRYLNISNSDIIAVRNFCRIDHMAIMSSARDLERKYLCKQDIEQKIKIIFTGNMNINIKSQFGFFCPTINNELMLEVKNSNLADYLDLTKIYAFNNNQYCQIYIILIKILEQRRIYLNNRQFVSLTAEVSSCITRLISELHIDLPQVYYQTSKDYEDQLENIISKKEFILKFQTMLNDVNYFNYLYPQFLINPKEILKQYYDRFNILKLLQLEDPLLINESHSFNQISQSIIFCLAAWQQESFKMEQRIFIKISTDHFSFIKYFMQQYFKIKFDNYDNQQTNGPMFEYLVISARVRQSQISTLLLELQNPEFVFQRFDLVIKDIPALILDYITKSHQCNYLRRIYSQYNNIHDAIQCLVIYLHAFAIFDEFDSLRSYIDLSVDEIVQVVDFFNRKLNVYIPLDSEFKSSKDFENYFLRMEIDLVTRLVKQLSEFLTLENIQQFFHQKLVQFEKRLQKEIKKLPIQSQKIIESAYIERRPSFNAVFQTSITYINILIKYEKELSNRFFMQLSTSSLNEIVECLYHLGFKYLSMKFYGVQELENYMLEKYKLEDLDNLIQSLLLNHNSDLLYDQFPFSIKPNQIIWDWVRLKGNQELIDLYSILAAGSYYSFNNSVQFILLSLEALLAFKHEYQNRKYLDLTEAQMNYVFIILDREGLKTKRLNTVQDLDDSLQDLGFQRLLKLYESIHQQVETDFDLKQFIVKIKSLDMQTLLLDAYDLIQNQQQPLNNQIIQLSLFTLVVDFNAQFLQIIYPLRTISLVQYYLNVKIPSMPFLFVQYDNQEHLKSKIIHFFEMHQNLLQFVKEQFVCSEETYRKSFINMYKQFAELQYLNNILKAFIDGKKLNRIQLVDLLFNLISVNYSQIKERDFDPQINAQQLVDIVQHIRKRLKIMMCMDIQPTTFKQLYDSCFNNPLVHRNILTNQMFIEIYKLQLNQQYIQESFQLEDFECLTEIKQPDQVQFELLTECDLLIQLMSLVEKFESITEQLRNRIIINFKQIVIETALTELQLRDGFDNLEVQNSKQFDIFVRRYQFVDKVQSYVIENQKFIEKPDERIFRNDSLKETEKVYYLLCQQNYLEKKANEFQYIQLALAIVYLKHIAPPIIKKPKMIIVQYSEQVLVEIINKLYSLKLINERINYKLVDLINNISANYEKQELIQILKQSLYIVNTNYLMKVFNYLPTKPLELIQQRIDHYKQDMLEKLTLEVLNCLLIEDVNDIENIDNQLLVSFLIFALYEFLLFQQQNQNKIVLPAVSQRTQRNVQAASPTKTIKSAPQTMRVQ